MGVNYREETRLIKEFIKISKKKGCLISAKLDIFERGEITKAILINPSIILIFSWAMETCPYEYGLYSYNMDQKKFLPSDKQDDHGNLTPRPWRRFFEDNKNLKDYFSVEKVKMQHTKNVSSTPIFSFHNLSMSINSGVPYVRPESNEIFQSGILDLSQIVAVIDKDYIDLLEKIDCEITEAKVWSSPLRFKTTKSYDDVEGVVMGLRVFDEVVKNG